MPGTEPQRQVHHCVGFGVPVPTNQVEDIGVTDAGGGFAHGPPPNRSRSGLATGSRTASP